MYSSRTTQIKKEEGYCLALRMLIPSIHWIYQRHGDNYGISRMNKNNSELVVFFISSTTSREEYSTNSDKWGFTSCYGLVTFASIHTLSFPTYIESNSSSFPNITKRIGVVMREKVTEETILLSKKSWEMMAEQRHYKGSSLDGEQRKK